MRAEILPCTCKHPSQDALHGRGNRVFNHSVKLSNPKGGSQIYRCTVCRSQKSV